MKLSNSRPVLNRDQCSIVYVNFKSHGINGWQYIAVVAQWHFGDNVLSWRNRDRTEKSSALSSDR
jgi:hypothetical protein